MDLSPPSNGRIPILCPRCGIGSNSPTSATDSSITSANCAARKGHSCPLEGLLSSHESPEYSSGTAVCRVQLLTAIHPMSDLTFNPTAASGGADWRVLYVSTGDGGTGEQTDVRRLNPQRLDHFGGKIIRIVPDLREHVSTSQVSENGQYRIPNDNPFVSTPGARKEIFAYGMRNHPFARIKECASSCSRSTSRSRTARLLSPGSRRDREHELFL